MLQRDDVTTSSRKLRQTEELVNEEKRKLRRQSAINTDILHELDGRRW